ncbi:hypothetical protein FHS23_001013 [Prauserella isguenensis]|uniref:DUF3558 domain-containing protein n=1 Tax=Prauserella isguenensis TaxID=1470180 RepID=A0A839RWI8_9PSEU|nr:DUF3558 family protein [Prauserella isguenensis]MBB3050018.1 hypothetical protein [Prauserella isguenensis]
MTTAIAAALSLTACGSESGSPESSPDSGQVSASGEQAAWQQKDPCSLLSEQDLRPYLGDEAGSVSPKRTSKFDRPTCEWRSGKYDGVRLALWQPPAPDIVTDTDKTVEVGERTGYITSETSTNCLMDVKAEPAYLQIDVNAADVDGGREHYCEVAAETARAALTKLGW